MISLLFIYHGNTRSDAMIDPGKYHRISAQIPVNITDI